MGVVGVGFPAAPPAPSPRTGKYNFLEYLVPGQRADQFGPRILIMHPNMAQSLVDYGFSSKGAVMEWL